MAAASPLPSSLLLPCRLAAAPSPGLGQGRRHPRHPGCLPGPASPACPQAWSPQSGPRVWSRGEVRPGITQQEVVGVHVVCKDRRLSEISEGGRGRSRGLGTESEAQPSHVRRTDSDQPVKVRREWGSRAGEPAHGRQAERQTDRLQMAERRRTASRGSTPGSRSITLWTEAPRV